MNKTLQNLLYAILIILMIPLYYLLKPDPPITAHGIFLPASKTTRKSISPDDVTVYEQIPNSYKVGGTIRTSIHYQNGKRQLMQQNIKLAKKLAAHAGYNGFLITEAGTTTTIPSPLDELILWGKAIEVNGEQ